MSWEPEVKEIQMRREKALELGGKDRVERHHSEGKLTIRERILLKSFAIIGTIMCTPYRLLRLFFDHPFIASFLSLFILSALIYAMKSKSGIPLISYCLALAVLLLLVFTKLVFIPITY